MRLCVIGNSHLASLKLGWDQSSPNDDCNSVQFFGAKGNQLLKTQLYGQKLIPVDSEVELQLKLTSGGFSEIDLAVFDAFILHGLGCNLTIFNCLQTLRLNDLLPIENELQHISHGCLLRVAVDLLQRSAMMKLASVIRQACDAPILISPQPFPDERVIDCNAPNWEFLKNASSPNLLGVYLEAIAQMICETGYNISLLPQPKETITSDIYTKFRFSKGAVRLANSFDVAHSERDFVHMNADYGILVLRDAFELLRNR